MPALSNLVASCNLAVVHCARVGHDMVNQLGLRKIRDSLALRQPTLQGSPEAALGLESPFALHNSGDSFRLGADGQVGASHCLRSRYLTLRDGRDERSGLGGSRHPFSGLGNDG